VKNIILKLYEAEAVKLGSFKLKSGLTSPIYFDLRVIVSYPELLSEVADAIGERADRLRFDSLCGVPYTALPIATALSLKRRLPMVMRRKEVKDYGTKKEVEGVFQKGERCLVIEDLATSGSSILETAEALLRQGLEVSDAVVLIDRGQGGAENLAERGIALHAVTTMDEILETLHREGKLSQEKLEEIKVKV